ncbi:MAG: FAD-dependent oxidoreductase, partial [Spirochaetia bacterium]|nr:FAD-dependent oxidoreductase [Spirochaetia bacterium]
MIRSKQLSERGKPVQFDRDIIILSNRGLGLESAILSASVKASVTLVELNNEEWSDQVNSHFSELNKYKNNGDLKTYENLRNKCRKLDVDMQTGAAELLSPWQVRINNYQNLTARKIILAMGTTPFIPPIKGIWDVSFLTPETVWKLDRLPSKLLILGGGRSGTEIARFFAVSGSNVTLIEAGADIVDSKDEKAGKQIRNQLES